MFVLTTMVKLEIFFYLRICATKNIRSMIITRMKIAGATTLNIAKATL
jgi:hypothetical protein